MLLQVRYDDGVLLKLKIKGNEDELKQLAFTLMDAIEDERVERVVDDTLLVVKLDG